MTFKLKSFAAMMGMAAGMAVLIAAMPASHAQDAAGAFDGKQTEAIKTIIRNYLLENPEVLREAMEVLNKRQEEVASEERKKSLVSLYKEASPFSSGDGKITLVEFFDYNCGYCRRAFESILDVQEKNKDFRVVFVEFPILSDESRIAAEAAIASAKQNKYFEFHRAMMQEKEPATEESVFRVAAAVGLDIEKLKVDMKAPDVAETIEKNLALGTAMGVQGTPAFFIGNEAIPGAPENLSEIVTAEIEKIRKDGCDIC